MKKLVLIFLISFMMVPRVFSYSIISDPDLFYSFFKNPRTTIEFTKLKDGTSYEKIRYRIKPDPFTESVPQCSIIDKGDIHFTGSQNRISVRSDAFSDDWSFSARDLKRPDVSCEAVIWFNQGISAGDSKISVTSSTGESEPFVLYTNKGFMGVVPDNPQETVFVFDNFSAVFSFETKFLRRSTIIDGTASLIAQISHGQLRPLCMDICVLRVVKLDLSINVFDIGAIRKQREIPSI